MVEMSVAITFIPRERKDVPVASPRPPGLQPVIRAHLRVGGAVIWVILVQFLVWKCQIFGVCLFRPDESCELMFPGSSLDCDIRRN